jgi:hypothetical protein
MLFRSVLLIAVATGVFGQQALKDALGLTEMQIWQLRQVKPIPVAHGDRAAAGRRPGDFAVMRPDEESLDEALHNPILDAVQQAKLTEIVKVLNRWAKASEAITAGLIDAGQWPGSALCLYPIPTYASEFHLSDSQVQRLEQLKRAAREPLETQIADKAANRSTMEIARLYQQLGATRAPRELALAVLDDAQRTQLATFEVGLKLVREAIELKLIPVPPRGEPLCM